jgi:hypothetical protein
MPTAPFVPQRRRSIREHWSTEDPAIVSTLSSCDVQPGRESARILFASRFAVVARACVGRFGVDGCCEGIALAIEVKVGETRIDVTNRWNARPRDVRFCEKVEVSA